MDLAASHPESLQPEPWSFCFLDVALEHVGFTRAVGTRDIPARDKPQTGANSFKRPHLGKKRRSSGVQAPSLRVTGHLPAVILLKTMAYWTLNGIFFSSKVNLTEIH